jgi:hypothetical protein
MLEAQQASEKVAPVKFNIDAALEMLAAHELKTLDVDPIPCRHSRSTPKLSRKRSNKSKYRSGTSTDAWPIR